MTSTDDSMALPQTEACQTVRPDRRRDRDLRRLVVVGNLMAERLRQFAAELDLSSGKNATRAERELTDRPASGAQLYRVAWMCWLGVFGGPHD